MQRAEAAGIKWPLGEDWDEGRLETALFGGPPRPRAAVLPMPDFAELHRQRQIHPHLTQQLLWEEFPRERAPGGGRVLSPCLVVTQRWAPSARPDRRFRALKSRLDWCAPPEPCMSHTYAPGNQISAPENAGHPGLQVRRLAVLLAGRVDQQTPVVLPGDGGARRPTLRQNNRALLPLPWTKDADRDTHGW
jgi:hypothetical protein